MSGLALRDFKGWWTFCRSRVSQVVTLPVILYTDSFHLEQTVFTPDMRIAEIQQALIKLYPNHYKKVNT